MTTADFNDSLDDAKTDLLLETSVIPWRELQIFFAGGKTIFVHPDIDLIEVAHQFALDNRKDVEAWMQKQQVGPVPDEVARSWYHDDVNVWAVVVKPWVLVQLAK